MLRSMDQKELDPTGGLNNDQTDEKGQTGNNRKSHRPVHHQPGL